MYDKVSGSRVLDPAKSLNPAFNRDMQCGLEIPYR